MFQTPPSNPKEYFESTFSEMTLGAVKPDYIVFIRHVGSLWEVSHAGPWKVGMKCPPGFRPTTWYSAVWGRKCPDERKVVQLFADSWLLYDRSGLYDFTMTAGWHAQRSAGLDQIAKAAFVRNLPQGGSSASRPPANFAVEEKEALAWFKEREQSRDDKVDRILVEEGHPLFHRR